MPFLHQKAPGAPEPAGPAASWSPARLAALAGLAEGTGPALEVTSPSEGRPLAVVRQAREGEARAAVDRAREAQRAWAARPVRERAAVGHRFARLVLDRRDEILDLLQAETGKARLAALEEVMDASRTAAYYAHAAPRLLRPQRHVGALPLLTRSTELRHPKGVVGVITPWNYPFTLPASDSVPALLAGNAVVIKPDHQTPLTALLVLALLREAGLPEGVARVVPGTGPVTGAELVDAVDYVMFTGSTATGRAIAARCGERLIGFSGELGGKNPLLVLPDADIPAAAVGAARACFSNAGQLCVGPERIYVHEAVRERFTEAFVAEVAGMRMGPGTSWETQLGSLTSPEHLARVHSQLDDAVARGARVLTGGAARPDVGPLFFAPTVLADVPESAALCREETFGPIVAVYPVASEEEAFARANDTPYGLNASLWTAPSRGRRLGARLEAGTVNVNEGYSAAWGTHSAAMGGWKESGLGRRHGPEGLLKYTEAQTIAVQRLLPIAPWPGLGGERWAGLLTGAVRMINRFR
ncbi:succinic semialdehyde dehydrogenase [Sinomonas halotolerans]|uniref:Succinic semialdehyde dehydrogenase n=1 Tax=Sinomonas halotolerans TaxID=1644133 RepID=A0ABU9X2V4_9MICC